MSGRKGIMVRMVAAALLCAVTLVAASCAKPSRSQIALGLVDSMQKGDFEAAAGHFDSTMSSAMPPSQLQGMWNAIAQQGGALKAHSLNRETKENGADTVFVTCEFEKLKFDLKVVFDSSDKVSGLWMVPTSQPAAGGK